MTPIHFLEASGVPAFTLQSCETKSGTESLGSRLAFTLQQGSLGPRPPPFLPSVCVHNNTRERNYCERKRKVKTGEAWERG